MGLEITGLGALFILALDIWALVSVLSSPASVAEKVLWALLILVLPLIGFLLWLIAGPRARPRLG